MATIISLRTIVEACCMYIHKYIWNNLF